MAAHRCSTIETLSIFTPLTPFPDIIEARAALRATARQ